MILSLSKKFICLNPPKTGTGYREYMFSDYADFYVEGISQSMRDIVNLNLFDNLHKFRHLNLKDCLSLLSNYNLNPDDFYIFTFVRNPWRRAESWYNMIINQAINKQPERENEIIDSRLNIDAFNLYTKRNDHSLSAYLSCEERDVDFCGKLENIDEDFSTLSALLNINPKSSLDFNITANLTSYHDEIKKLWVDESINSIRCSNISIIKEFDYIFSK